MKTGTLFVALVVAGACIAGIVLVTGGGVSTEGNKKKAVQEEECLPVSKSGPWPKVVVAEKDFEFDVMASGSTKKHKFIVKNEGEAPLNLKLKSTSCSCTVGELDKDSIEPGEEGEVELEWTPTAAEAEFHKYAEICTNDPKNPLITLSVKGRVEELLKSSPSPLSGLKLNKVTRDRKVNLTVELYSGVLEKFNITGVKPSSPDIKTKIEPFTEEDLKVEGAKSGYRVLVEFDPKNLKVGPIQESILVQTDVEEAKEWSFPMRGFFTGSILAMPYIPEGEENPKHRWRYEDLQVHLGDISAANGAKGWCRMSLVDIPKDLDLKITGVESSMEAVTASTEELSSPTEGEKLFAVTIEVKPGVEIGNHKATVTLKSNHPDAPEIQFTLQFQAF